MKMTFGRVFLASPHGRHGLGQFFLGKHPRTQCTAGLLLDSSFESFPDPQKGSKN